MNRKQRRAARVLARKSQAPLDNIVAVHESGHAVARYLTAAAMGYGPEEAISSIEISAGGLQHLGTSFDGKAEMFSQAVTLGPMLSKEIDGFFTMGDRKPGDTVSPDVFFTVISEARAGGADIEKWLQARVLIGVMGPIAESLSTGRPPADVLESYESEGDLNEIIRDCKWAGVPDSEISQRINSAIERALEFFSRQGVLDAVNALAAHLVKSGTTDGKTAAQIIEAALDAAPA